MRYIYKAKVKKVEQRKQMARAFKTGKKLPEGGDEVHVDYDDIGWFVVLDMGIALGVGDNKPKLESGDEVRLVLET